MLTWLRENRHGDYWRHGSVRLGADGAGYERIAVPDDARRRLGRRLPQQLLPHRRRAAASRRAAPAAGRSVGARRPDARRCPGPRIDLDVEMAAWFDRWLRGRGERDDVRLALRRVRPHLHPARAGPRPARGLLGLRLPSVPPTRPWSVELGRAARWPSSPDVGTAAWIDCAGHLPWGLSGDQRLDDARSLTWDARPARRGPSSATRGSRLRVSADAPAASLSVKLCDVFPDGTSALVTRGTLDLAFRDGVHGAPAPLVPGREYDVELDLDACAYALVARPTAAGQRRRRRLAQHRRPAGPGHPHRPRGSSSSCPLLRGRPPGAGLHPRRRRTPRSPLDGVDLGRSATTCSRRTTTRAHPHGVGLRRAVRRPGARGLPRRGGRRPAYLRADRPRRSRRSSSPGRGVACQVRLDDGLDHHRRRVRRRDRDVGTPRRRGGQPPHLAGACYPADVAAKVSVSERPT